MDIDPGNTTNASCDVDGQHGEHGIFWGRHLDQRKGREGVHAIFWKPASLHDMTPCPSGEKIMPDFPLLNGQVFWVRVSQGQSGSSFVIGFETYIYWSCDIGQEFADALAERSRNGVKVHVLLDWVSSAKVEQRLIDEMAKAGVQIRKFHPLHWSHLGRLNNRTHRELLVVDGRMAFTGGVGIAPQWSGHAQDPNHWRDTHFQVEGPVVAQMQSVFLGNWIKVNG